MINQTNNETYKPADLVTTFRVRNGIFLVEFKYLQNKLHRPSMARPVLREPLLCTFLQITTTCFIPNRLGVDGVWLYSGIVYDLVV